MSANRFLVVAADLAAAYEEMAALTAAILDEERLIAGRKRMITPPEGWPGSSEDKRRTAQEITFATDGQMAEMTQRLAALTEDKLFAAARIQGLEAERRALEALVQMRAAGMADGDLPGRDTVQRGQGGGENVAGH